MFGFEGMPGNQMEPDRGGLNLTTAENRTYGGSDYMLAKVGGAWDALLGEVVSSGPFPIRTLISKSVKTDFTPAATGLANIPRIILG